MTLSSCTEGAGAGAGAGAGVPSGSGAGCGGGVSAVVEFAAGGGTAVSCTSHAWESPWLATFSPAGVSAFISINDARLVWPDSVDVGDSAGLVGTGARLGS